MKTNDTYEFLSALSQSMSAEDLMLAGLQGIIAAEIVRKRLSLHMTQKEFAEYMGVSQGMISKWEKGDSNFTLQTLVQIASKLDIQMQCPFVMEPPRRYTTSGSNVIDFASYRKQRWTAERSETVHFYNADSEPKEM